MCQSVLDVFACCNLFQQDIFTETSQAGEDGMRIGGPQDLE